MIRKGWFIGISVVAIVLLVLGSLSNVVGYQSIKSTVIDSPLFQTRTLRATNRQQNILTSDYLGKGLNQISFPLKDNRSILIKQIIDRIRTMDDKQFDRFQNLIWCNKQQYSNNPDIIILNLIKQLITSKGINISDYNTMKDKNKPPTYIEFTCKLNIPLCFFMNLITYLVTIISYSFYFIVHLFTLNQCQYGYLQ